MNLLSQSRLCCQNVGRLCNASNKVATLTIITRSISTSQWQKFMQILNVDKESTPKDIKDSFLKLSKLYHPDNKDTGSHIKFVELKEAYDALKDGHPNTSSSSSSSPTSKNNYNRFYDTDVTYAAHKRYRERYKDYQTAYERGYGFGGPYRHRTTPWEDLKRDKNYRRMKYNESSFGDRARPLVSITVFMSAIAWIIIYSSAMLIWSYDDKVKVGMSKYKASSYDDYMAYQEYLKKKEAARILNFKKFHKIVEEDPYYQEEETDKSGRNVAK